MNTLLIVGTGITGAGAAHLFAKKQDWNVLTLARSEKSELPSNGHISADLLDPSSLDAAREQLAEVTHVFYAALKPDTDPHVEAAENGAMFDNLLDALGRADAKLERVAFLQGGKVYGAHLGVYQTPAKEDDSRHFPPNLYFNHEDSARRRSEEEGWAWTALRPDIVIGHSQNSAMNLGNLIGVYGALCREHGVAMQFPGTKEAYNVLVNVTDQDVLASALEWAIENKADGAFNITNGDVFRWSQVWPAIADWFGLSAGAPQPISLEERVGGMQETWQSIAERENLAQPELDKIALGGFGDFIFHVETDAIFDTTKARQAGFDAMNRQSVDSFINHLEGMRKRKLIP